MSNPVPIPLTDPIAQPVRDEFKRKREKDPQEGLITQPWIDYFNQFGVQIQNAATSVKSASVSAQTASIGATDIAGGSLSTGLYRLSYYTRITRAAGVSSSLEVTLDWQDRGQALSFTGAAIVGNIVTEFQQDTLFLRIDGGVAPVRYSTTRVSVGVPTMEYSLDVVLELVKG